MFPDPKVKNDLYEGDLAGDMHAPRSPRSARARSRSLPRCARTLEAPSPLCELLAARAEGKASTAYLFATAEGKPHWRDWVFGNVHRVCDLAGVPKVTAHAMRGLLSRRSPPSVGSRAT